MPKHSLIEFRRIFTFDFEFGESRSLDDIVQNLSGKFDFEEVHNFAEVIERLRNKGHLCEWDKAIAINSSVVYPPMIYFLIFQTSDSGGKLFVLETNESWYSYDHVLRSMRSFSKIAGVICRYRGLC